jgi:transcriptional regulator with XRE-family HTH domain
MAKSPAPKISPKIGDFLRARRRLLDLTLESVAEKCEITKGFLSDVERDNSSPSVATLVRLCEVLNISVGSLFSSVGSSVIRKDERVPIKFGGIKMQDYLLSPTGATKAQVIMSDMAPGGTGGDKLYSLRCEEEFIFVLAGSVTISVESEDTVLMRHDAMTFDPRRLHSFRNSSTTKPAQALFILMPPPL